MPTASFVQDNFLAGEFSKTASGQIHNPRYKLALSTCLNSMPLEQGAWTRRPGTRYAFHTRLGAQGRVLPFDFKEAAPYTLELTENTLRFRNGVTLIYSNDVRTVSSVSTANPAVVQTDAAHNWQSGNSVYFVFGDATSPLLQGRLFIITVTDTDKFSLADALTGSNIDGSTLGWTTPGVTVSARRVTEIVTPYSASQLPDVRMVQADDEAAILHGSVTPQKLSVLSEPSDSANATFSLTPADFEDGPYLDPIPGSFITPSQLNGFVGLTFSFQTWSSTAVYNAGDYVTFSGSTYKSLVDLNVNQTPGTSSSWGSVGASDVIGNFTSDDIGRHIRILSEPLPWDGTHTYAAGDKVAYSDLYYTSLVGSNTGNQPGSDATKWAPNTANAIWSWGAITGLTGATSTMISRTAGTAIGNMTASSTGLSGAFDGTTSKVTVPNSSYIFAASGYIGKDFGGSPEVIVYGQYYGSTNEGIVGNSGSPVSGDLVQINLRASQTLPTSESDGTLLGTTGRLSAVAGQLRQINSSDTTTAWRYVWFEVLAYNSTGSPDAGQALICAQAQFFSAVATANGITIQLLGPDLLYTTASTTWRLGLFSNRLGWPKSGTYTEGRLWLSGVVDNRVDASVPNDIFNFAPTESDGTVTDANAISYTFNSPGRNPVFWLLPVQQGILCGTQAGEWLIQATSNNNILTPTSIQARRVTRIGCANIEPVETGMTAAFVQRYGRKLQEYFADVFSGKFASPDLAKEAKHLTVGGLEEIAHQYEVSPVIWMRRGDGALIGCSYKRESLFSSQGPTFNGFHRHTLGSGRTVESMRVSSNADGTLDSPVMVTNDSNTNIRHVEVMADVFEEADDLSTAWFLDDAAPATSYSTGTLTSGAQGVKANGFWHLNGKTVSMWAGGLDLGDFAVSNGTIEIPYGSRGPLVDPNDPTQFTAAFVSGFSGAMPIVAGFTYNSDGAMLPVQTQPESGARTGPGFGKVRKIYGVQMQLVATWGLYVGKSFTAPHLRRAQLRTTGGSRNLYQTELMTDMYKDTAEVFAQSLNESICWRIGRPYPATVAAIGGFQSIADE